MPGGPFVVRGPGGAARYGVGGPPGADPPASGPGSLKAGFGTGGSWFGGFGADEALDSVGVQPDGKIVAAVYEDGGGITIVRLKPDGTPDPGWNDNESNIWSEAQTPGDSPKGAIAQDSLGRTYVTSAVAVPLTTEVPKKTRSGRSAFAGAAGSARAGAFSAGGGFPGGGARWSGGVRALRRRGGAGARGAAPPGKR